MEEIKQKIGVVCEEVINAIQRNEDEKVDSVDYKKIDEEPRLDGEDEQPRVLWEEELVLSMWHKDQHVPDSLIGSFEFLQSLEGSEQSDPMVGPSVIEENQSPVLRGHCSPPYNINTDGLGRGEPECNGPDCLPRFEDFFGGVGLPNKDQG